ncbi:radical SAM enzyme [Lentithecium fluviatile CBS 122367]|uniref:Radical SAM enzyme n=1 Tax=Lentithecium fluviatile CBS 122367 TaxID=1168545 RepID=A0A6G1JEU2_9PLEO|nr:radical SAM enzyme [Lentithecium fluviatile CBS 122367]
MGAILATTAAITIASTALYIHKSRTLGRRLRILFKKHYLKHTIPISVNYHFTRKCNAECGFCFHTELDSHYEPLETAQRGLHLLHEEGMEKLNFAGGEPFLYHDLLGSMCRFAKEDLRLQSVSIVSNGTKVTEKWLRKYGKYIDILAISCDSFNADTNAAIGRKDRHSQKVFDNVAQLFKIRDWCRELGIKFKLNTVVCSLNWGEDMVDTVTRLAPFRWKVFQVLIVNGENDNDKRIRDARKFVVTDEQFNMFCEKHKGVKGFTPETSSMMQKSYLILDEHLKFLDKDKYHNKNSGSILEVGVQKALSQVDWDEKNFRARGGIYDWTRREETGGCGGGSNGGGALDGIDRRELQF